MTIAEATLVIRWEEDSAKYALLKLLDYIEEKALLGTVVKIEVVE